MENKNVFNETVETLTKDASSLQQKFHKLQETGDIRASIDCLRLLKETLSLIKEYDWHLEYSEYKTDGQRQVAVWEQNHCGDIRNHKIWNVGRISVKDNGDYIISEMSDDLEDNLINLGIAMKHAILQIMDKYKNIDYDTAYQYVKTLPDNLIEGDDEECVPVFGLTHKS